MVSKDKDKFFFQHYGLTERDVERYLGAALSAGGDYADLYVFTIHNLSSTATRSACLWRTSDRAVRAKNTAISGLWFPK